MAYMDVLARMCLVHGSSTGWAVGRKGGFNPHGPSTLHPKGWDDRGVGAGGPGVLFPCGAGAGAAGAVGPAKGPMGLGGCLPTSAPSPLAHSPVP